MRWTVPLLTLVAAIACGEDEQEPPWVPPEPDSNHGYVCAADDSGFPLFSKACRDASDCTTFAHVLNCCGDRVMVGVTATESAGFEQFETACRRLFPACACSAGPLQAEDGTTEQDGKVVVECVEEQCMTTTEVEPDGTAGSAGS